MFARGNRQHDDTASCRFQCCLESGAMQLAHSVICNDENAAMIVQRAQQCTRIVKQPRAKMNVIAAVA